MFSQRLPENLEPNEYAKLLAAKRAAGVRLLDLTESNPTRAGIPYPEAEILAALADARSLVYEPAPRGLLSAREAISEYYAQRGESVGADRILLTASTSEAYAYIFALLCGLADRFLVPTPSYPLFDLLAGIAGVRLTPYPLSYEGDNIGWRVGIDEFKKLASEEPKGVILVNPNNPTGSSLRPWERDILAEQCDRHDMAIISDEVFSDYLSVDAGDTELVRSMVSSRDVPSFTLSGLSKVCGLPQLKLGWIVVNGPPRWREEAMRRLELIADTYLSVGAPVQHAAAKLLSRRLPIQQAIRDRTCRNAKALATAVERLGAGKAKALASDGGWYAVLEVPDRHTDEEWTLMLLHKDDVHVHPGYFFGFPREAFLVLSLLTREEEFQVGVDRLLARVARA